MDEPQSKNYLEEPVQDELFSEILLFFSHFLDMVSQISFFAILHDNDEETVFDVTVDVLHYMRMSQVAEEFGLLSQSYFMFGRFFLFVVHLAQKHLLCYEVLSRIFSGTDQRRTACVIGRLPKFPLPMTFSSLYLSLYWFDWLSISGQNINIILILGRMPPKRPLALKIKKDDHEEMMVSDEGGDSQKKVPDKIVKATDHVFVSGLKAAYNIEQLKENQIDVIISMITQKDMQPFPEEFIYHDFPVADNQSQSMGKEFDMITNLMLEYTTQGKNVLVHCREVGYGNVGHLKSSVDRDSLPNEDEQAELRSQFQYTQGDICKS